MKNCHNCKHLEYYQGYFDDYGSSGFYCKGRVYKTEKQESKHLDKLDKEEYRNKPKKCFKKEDENENSRI